MAQEGISAATGAKNIAIKNITAQDTDVSPVRPPSATPAEDSTNVVTVEVPQTAPAQVAMASASIAFSMRGTLPSSSSRPPTEQAPNSVPSVSNISTIQNASIVHRKVTIKLAVPLAAIYAEKSKPSVKTFRKERSKKSRKGCTTSIERLSATLVS